MKKTDEALKKNWWMVAQGLAQVQVFVRPEDFKSIDELNESFDICGGCWVFTLRPGVQLSVTIPGFNTELPAYRKVAFLVNGSHRRH
jgi:hypothetical protein